MTTPNSFSGSAQATTLTGTGIGASDSTFTVASISTWKETIGSNVGSYLGTSGNFVVTIDYGTSSEEKVLCSGPITSTTINVVTRGYDGTYSGTPGTGVSHGAGAVVVHTISTDVPYEAASAYAKTTAITAGTAGAVPVATLGTGALPSGVTVPTAQISSGTLPTGVTASKVFSGTTSITGITGYNNYMIIATASYLAGSTTATGVTQSLTIAYSGGSTYGGLGASTGNLNGTGGSNQPLTISLTSVVANATSAGQTFSFSLVKSSLSTTTTSSQNIQVIGYN